MGVKALKRKENIGIGFTLDSRVVTRCLALLYKSSFMTFCGALSSLVNARSWTNAHDGQKYKSAWGYLRKAMHADSEMGAGSHYPATSQRKSVGSPPLQLRGWGTDF